MDSHSTRSEALLGVHVGIAGVKALLADAQGRVLSAAAEPVRVLSDHPLQAEQDAELWWGAAVSAMRRCLDAEPERRVAAVGLVGQKHALLPLDAEGEALCRAILGPDGRAVEEARAVRAVFPAAARRSGRQIVPGLLLPKWRYLLAHRADIVGRIRHLVFAKDWIRYRLTGAFLTDRTEASASQLFDFRRNTWSDALASFFELPIEILPEVRSSCARAGRVHAAGAAETGLAVGTPVAAGAGDEEAAALACGAVGQGVVAVNLRTAATVVGWHRYRSTAGGLVWNRHVVSAGYAATGTVLSAGRALRWIRRAAFPADMTLTNVLGAAEASDSQGTSLVFLPGLVGERSPVRDAQATGAFVGLRPLHGRGHLARAVLEGVALSIAEILVLMRAAGVRVRELRLTSDGTASPFWCRLIASAAQVPVRAVGGTEGPALGAALIAGCMLAGESDPSERAGRWIEPGPETGPDSAETKRLAVLGTMLRSARNALRGVRTR